MGEIEKVWEASGGFVKRNLTVPGCSRRLWDARWAQEATQAAPESPVGGSWIALGGSWDLGVLLALLGAGMCPVA